MSSAEVTKTSTRNMWTVTFKNAKGQVLRVQDVRSSKANAVAHAFDVWRSWDVDALAWKAGR